MYSSKKLFKPLGRCQALLLAALMAGCGGGGGGGDVGTGGGVAPGATIAPGAPGSSSTAPTVKAASPGDNAVNVPTNQSAGTATAVSATFSQAMDPATIVSSPAGTLPTFTLEDAAGGNVPGTVAMNADNTMATFSPSALALAVGTTYTARVSTAARSAGGTAMANPVAWRFTTGAIAAIGRLPVNLGRAGSFAVLAKSGISTVPGSAITGDIGVSPIDRTAITGFSETMDSTNVFSTAAQVTGKIFAADYAAPTPANLTTAISDMETAYVDAAGRTLPDSTELNAGEIGGLTLVPGLYKWGTDVLISTNVTLSGGPNDVWIFQIAGKLTQANGTRVTLTGGALAKNVFWQTFGAAAIGTTAHFEGVVLSKTAINLGTNATANARLLAQTAVTLQQNAVRQPAP